jgi:hypothetical protein
MRKAFDGIEKIPHPEEAVEQLSRRSVPSMSNSLEVQVLYPS